MNKKYTTNGKESDPLLILAHGAGADSQSDFMQQLAGLVAEQGLYVVRFDFPYMQKRQQDGKKRPPDRAPTLLAAFHRVVADFDRPCVIAGKSMGGRMATLLASSENCPETVKACAALGYPFHPLGKPEKLRTEHLQVLLRPTLILQGSRDKMGSIEEVAEYSLNPGIDIQWLMDGDHDLKPPKLSGFDHSHHIHSAAVALAEFALARLS